MICERRAALQNGEFETREIEGKRYIEAYFAVFGAVYPLWDKGIETIDPGAFDLSMDTDVRALTNHDTTLVLGRTTAGTLELKVDDRGLWGRIEINDADTDAVNLYERVKRRDVTQCSFGFEILAEEIENRDDGMTVWHLTSVRLHEVSICSFPAYEETSAVVVSRQNELEEIEKRKAEKWRAEMLTKLKGEN